MANEEDRELEGDLHKLDEVLDGRYRVVGQFVSHAARSIEQSRRVSYSRF